jgi:hypothetical protein
MVNGMAISSAHAIAGVARKTWRFEIAHWGFYFLGRKKVNELQLYDPVCLRGAQAESLAMRGFAWSVRYAYEKP